MYIITSQIISYIRILDKSIRLGLKKKQVKTKQGIKRNTEKRIGNFHAVKGTPGKS